MKILVCTDGSEHSQKAIDEASVIAAGCKTDEVAVIHVYSQTEGYPFTTEGMTGQQMEAFQKMREDQDEQRKKILSEAEKILKGNNIKTRTILKEGSPSDTIVKVAREEGFDMIVVGSRGFGGLKKLLLGSVSNAVIQEAENCSVLVVK